MTGLPGVLDVLNDDQRRAAFTLAVANGEQTVDPSEPKIWIESREGDESTDREVRFTYSLQGPHFIELLEQVNPGPYLNLTGGRRVHHLGYYTDDLRCASAMLEANGYRRELSGVTEDGGIGRASFHYNPEAPGMWIELVSDEIASDSSSDAKGLPR